ncbi:MAG: type II toxin-antitoxin system HicB family antitoxin [Planctomycetota bacterium]|jgi:predicted RNase H-like HicB family nuclease|nr:type II toxin-antitoxin system HicB family antitoxin [Planctomycetota bacterium]
MRYAYPACFYPEDDGRYSVEFVDLPLATFGDDFADALAMAADAAVGRILLMRESGEELPPPSALADITPNASGVAALVNVDLPTVRDNRAACLA